MSEHEENVETRLEAAREAITGWRAGRAKLGPMPAPLWGEVIALARELGVGRVSRELQMNHGAISRQVDPKSAAAKKSPSPAARSEFVEVPKPPLMAKQIGTVIELTSASGNRLTVRLSESVDVGLLLSQFQARQ